MPSLKLSSDKKSDTMSTTNMADSTSSRKTWKRAPAPVVNDGSSSPLSDAEIDAFVQKAASTRLDALPALSAFQRQMDRYPQLSANAQMEIVLDFQKARQAKELLEATPRLSAAKRRNLQELASREERAMEYLVGSNFRLLLLICREKAEERFGREKAMSMMSDLVGEAMVALVKAVHDYDPAKCPVFSTYAARVIRDKVSMSISKDAPIRLAPSWARLKRIATVRIPQLASELGRQPTSEEVQAYLLEYCLEWANQRLTPDQQKLPEAQRVDLMMAKLRKQGMLGALSAIQEVLTAAQPVASLDAAVGEDGSSSLGDLLPGASMHDDGFSDLELTQLRDTLQDALSRLSERDREIVVMRFGLDGSPRQTYQSIGAHFGVTAERIRQIERNVLTKLAAPSALRESLAAFLPSLDGVDLDTVKPDPQAGR